jgi:hypothetical protein
MFLEKYKEYSRCNKHVARALNNATDYWKNYKSCTEKLEKVTSGIILAVLPKLKKSWGLKLALV